jgi:hypothetical protein
MAYTYKIDTDPEIIAWLEKDGYQVIRQPHHPNAYMNAPWHSAEEAENWAMAEIARLEANDVQAASQATKIDEIHDMLTKLTAK